MKNISCSMKNISIFPNLRIVDKPRLYQNNTIVEMKAADVMSTDRFPVAYKFQYKGVASAIVEFPRMFSVGQVVRITAIPEAYRGKFYGKLGKPVKASNGKWYLENKVRFHIRRIKHGPGYEDILKEAEVITHE